MNPREDLLRRLATHAYQFRPESPFQLASGKSSPEYLDCKLALGRAETMVALGSTILGLLDARSVAIGGLTMGADPIAMSACQASAGRAQPLRWFSVRKEPKAHGQRKLIEGPVETGESVTIVDDVVTSGDSTIKAISAARDAEIRVVQVIVLVDREELCPRENLLGLEKITRAAGPDTSVVAIFKKSDIKSEWEALRNPLRATG